MAANVYMPSRLCCVPNLMHGAMDRAGTSCLYRDDINVTLYTVKGMNFNRFHINLLLFAKKKKVASSLLSVIMPTISIGNYLIHRLKEVGVETIFGVPGDYNMVLSNLELLGYMSRYSSCQSFLATP
jgi:hypothetical protein